MEGEEDAEKRWSWRVEGSFLFQYATSYRPRLTGRSAYLRPHRTVRASRTCKSGMNNAARETNILLPERSGRDSASPAIEATFQPFNSSTFQLFNLSTLQLFNLSTSNFKREQDLIALHLFRRQSVGSVRILNGLQCASNRRDSNEYRNRRKSRGHRRSS